MQSATSSLVRGLMLCQRTLSQPGDFTKSPNDPLRVPVARFTTNNECGPLITEATVRPDAR